MTSGTVLAVLILAIVGVVAGLAWCDRNQPVPQRRADDGSGDTFWDPY